MQIVFAGNVVVQNGNFPLFSSLLMLLLLFTQKVIKGIYKNTCAPIASYSAGRWAAQSANSLRYVNMGDQTLRLSFEESNK